MFPIRDHNPSSRTPFVNYGLLALNILIFLSYQPLFANPQTLHSFFLSWGMVPARLSAGDGGYTLISSMFLHGGWMHLIGNMLFLYIFGDNLEDQLGHLGYLAFYLLGGVGAALAQYAADPGAMVPMVGASGAIAAVMGGYLLLFPKARVDVLFIIIIIIRILPIPAWGVLGMWFGLQIFNGLAATPGMGGVAHWAHAGGFVAGVLLMLPWFYWRGGPGFFWDSAAGHPPNPEAQYRLVQTGVPKVRGRARPGPGAAGGKVIRLSSSSVPKTRGRPRR